LGYTNVTLDEASGEWPAKIGIFVYEPSDLYPNAMAALDHTLSSPPGIWQNIEPPDRYPVTVAGVQGEQIVVCCDILYRRVHASFDVEWIPSTIREVYFDHSGVIWKIWVRSHRDMSEIAYIDFEHILETFQILD
jgi:hypothetical protein